MSFDRGDYLLSQQTSNWKIVNSLWVAVVILGCSCLSIVGWIWAAAMAQTRRAWIAAAVWGGVSVVTFSLFAAFSSDPDEPVTGIQSFLSFVLVGAWGAQVVHAFLVMKLVLKEKLLVQDRKTSARQAYISSLAQSPPPTTHPSQPGGPTPFADYGNFYEEGLSAKPPSPEGWTRSPDPNPRPAQAEAVTSRVDVNSAMTDELLSLPGIDQRAVDAIVSARKRRGGFHNLGDLTAAAGLQPHQMVALSEAVIFGPFDPPQPPRGNGRVLDL